MTTGSYNRYPQKKRATESGYVSPVCGESLRLPQPRGKKAAFTVAELVVVLALLVLIGGMVSTFLVFMNAYGAKNAKESRRVGEITQIRAETDCWFSYADESGEAVSFAPRATGGTPSAFAAKHLIEEGESVVVAACGEKTIVLTGTADGCEIFFYYGADAPQNRTLFLENAYGMLFYDESAPYSASPAAKIRFTVDLRLQGKIYACEVIV